MLQVCPLEPENNNYIFHGVGTALTEGSFGNYGGVVYAYNETHTFLWLPSNYSQQRYMVKGNADGPWVSSNISNRGYMTYVGGVWIRTGYPEIVSSRANIFNKIINLSGTNIQNF
jgi:hypothetical protein